MSAVRGDGVTVRYNGRVAVDGVDLAVEAGAWLGVIGPNGSGKSSLLRAIAGAVPWTGSIDIHGEPRAELGRREAARRIALLPQTPVIPPGMLVADYVLLGRTPHLGPLAVEGARDRKIVMEALERLDASSLADRRIDRLSGGEQQRVVLARAVAQQPTVLLLDEPTTALDIGHQQQVLDLVDELRRTQMLTVVSALHDLTLAAQYADRLVVLDGGRVVESGSADEVLSENLLARFSGARVEIVRSGDGTPVVVPRRARRRPVPQA